jgi:uncharacterized membrane protein
MRVNLACVLALLAQQVAWHGMLRWAGGSTALLVILGMPLAAVLVLHLARRPSARFWSGVVALLTFCHGITEAWTLPGALTPGLVEAVVSALAVTSASWDGMRARFARKRPAPPNV